MGTILAIIFGTCILLCASLFLLPVLLVLGVLALVFSGIFAGMELVLVGLAAIAVVIATILFMHLLVPILIPVLLICAIVYVCKHIGRSHA
jgi:hypothetical protein